MFFTPSLLRRQPRGACRHCHAMSGDPAAAVFFENLADADVAALKRLRFALTATPYCLSHPVWIADSPEGHAAIAMQ